MAFDNYFTRTGILFDALLSYSYFRKTLSLSIRSSCPWLGVRMIILILESSRYFFPTSKFVKKKSSRRSILSSLFTSFISFLKNSPYWTDALSAWEAVIKLILTKFYRWIFEFFRRSSFFVTKIESGLRTDALSTTTEPIVDFSNILFNVATTQ